MISEIERRIPGNERLTEGEARWCLGPNSNIWELGRIAHNLRCRMHPADRVTYQVDRNINYTNVCVSGCRFCAFSRPQGHPEAWTLSIQEIIDKVSKTAASDGTGILLQGGHNPDIPFEYYTDLLKAIQARFPTIHIHAFSPPEIVAFSSFYSMTVLRIIRNLIDAGLDSIPGGGAEILSDNIRQNISPGKCSSDGWLDVMRTAHSQGLKTTATMVIGLGESIDERLTHLLRIRDLQDETGGFTAFIPWTLQPEKTRMESGSSKVGGLEYLRLQAAARLILDNISHHQVSWLTQGLRLGSLALFFGADDFSSVMMEEKVVASTGSVFETTEKEICEIIKTSGFKPIKRLTLYQNIHHG